MTDPQLARRGTPERGDPKPAAAPDAGKQQEGAGTTIDLDVVLDLATRLEATFDPGGTLPDDCEEWAAEHMDLIGKLRGLAECALMDDDEDFSSEEGDS